MITESEYVLIQIKENDKMEKENSLLKAAIEMVKANGYNVTCKEEKPETSHLETAKEVVKEVGTGVGHFMRGLGRITLEKANAVKETVAESASTVYAKGK